MRLVGEQDPYESDRTVGLHAVMRAHFLVADFSITNGLKILAVGPKSVDLLHSAVYRQFVTLGQREKWPHSLDKCASLLFGINKGHAFHDANKRTSLLVTLLYLQKRCVNRTPTVSDKVFEDFLVQLADNKLGRYPRYRDMSASGDPDFEIRFISDWLHRNTREIDKRYYDVTYQQLNGILHRFGFTLDNPSKNYIDVVKVEESTSFFGLGPSRQRKVAIAQIGFPGWKSQVGRGALKTVREKTGLTADRGYDSQSFFRDVDPLHALIDKYKVPLARLADR